MTVFWLYLKWFPQDNSGNIITPARVVDREHCVHIILHIFFKKKNVKKSWGCAKIISLLHEVANYRIACAQNPLLSKIE